MIWMELVVGGTLEPLTVMVTVLGEAVVFREKLTVLVPKLVIKSFVAPARVPVHWQSV